MRPSSTRGAGAAGGGPETRRQRRGARPPSCGPSCANCWFGTLDGEANSADKYALVWAEDKEAPREERAAGEPGGGNRSSYGCEPVSRVRDRALAVVRGLEPGGPQEAAGQPEVSEGAIHVLVSHGDTIQILRTAWLLH